MGKRELPKTTRVKIACPRCNSPQSFRPRTLKDEDPEGKMWLVVIECTMCHWRKILFEGTPEQVRLKKDIDKLRGKAMRGDPVQPVLRKRQKRLRESQ